MARFSREQINLIKEKMGVNRIWSFSKMSTMTQCSWLYQLKYIQHLKGIQDSCYTYWGTVAHEIIQDYYDGKHKSHKDMLVELGVKMVEYNLECKKRPHIKFNSESEYDNYMANLKHYFANTDIIPHTVKNERPIITAMQGKEKHVFQGFIDSIYLDDDGNIVVLDYKTSSDSEFTGAKLHKKALQLFIYAHGLVNYQKVPLDRIIIRYDMMKYVNISYMQKNGKMKTMRKARKDYVSYLYSKLVKDFADYNNRGEVIEKEIAKLNKKMSAKCRTEDEIVELGSNIAELEEQLSSLKVYDPIEVDDYITQAMELNTLDFLPQHIKDIYKVENAYIDIKMTEDILNDAVSTVVTTLDDIVERESKNDELAFNRGDIKDNESYFCKNLCDMRDHCKFFQAHKENENLYKKDEVGDSDDDIMAMLGLL